MSGPHGYFGLDDVDNGDTMSLGNSKFIFVLVPDDGSINIQTTGWESDNIDDAFGSGGTVNPFDFDNNDRLGVISKYNVYNAGNNFGVGAHDDPSKQKRGPRNRGRF